MKPKQLYQLKRFYGLEKNWKVTTAIIGSVVLIIAVLIFMKNRGEKTPSGPLARMRLRRKARPRG